MSPDEVLESMRRSLPVNDGFECYPFKVGSYNDVINAPFTLDYDYNTMAVLVLNTPKMFDVSFRRWLVEKAEGGDYNEAAERVPNPIQSFMQDRMQDAAKELSDLTPEVMHDYDLWPNRRPKILMCTCGHVAGAAYYYKPEPPPEIIGLPSPKMIGVSLHPKYGGHFAFRAVFIFPGMSLPEEFMEPSPPKILHTESSITKTIELFNVHWRDGRFRDCGSPKERYSQQQTDYFARPPAERWQVIADWFENPII